MFHWLSYCTSNAKRESGCQFYFQQSFQQRFKRTFRFKAVIADAFPLCAMRRGFDIKSNRRRSVCLRITSACPSDLHAPFDCPRRDRDHDCLGGWVNA